MPRVEVPARPSSAILTNPHLVAGHPERLAYVLESSFNLRGTTIDIRHAPMSATLNARMNVNG